jgi:hypothetical protein
MRSRWGRLPGQVCSGSLQGRAAQGQCAGGGRTNADCSSVLAAMATRTDERSKNEPASGYFFQICFSWLSRPGTIGADPVPWE